MLELCNEHGYIMWNIRPDGIERQCILYRNGVEIDPMTDDAADIRMLFHAFVLKNLPLENRSIYLQNLPIWLQSETTKAVHIG